MTTKTLAAVLILSGQLGAPAQDQPDTPQPPRPGAVDAAIEPAAGDTGLKLNFRNVPLATVLDYLSQEAGFIIVMDTEVEGTVSAWSHQAVTKDEAVELLNTVLFAKGYSVIRSGRTLMIVARDEAKRRSIPVVSGSDPERIPLTDVMVTQIIPVRTVSAPQLMATLEPLLGEHATLTANEGANSLVMTDSQKNIRRIAQIVEALDSALTGVATIRVFPLQYATAAATAEMIKTVFENPNSGSNGRDRSRGGRPDFRFGPPGGDERGRDRGRDGRGDESSAALDANSRVVAVADERSNSVIVGAPEDTMFLVEQLIRETDTNVIDPTEIRVFKLKNADPIELAEVLNGLFENETSRGNEQSERGRFPFFFGRGGPGDRGGDRGDDRQNSLQSDQKVIAVPDSRTTSLVVSASRQIMPQIAQMIEQLDASGDKKQQVFVYELDHADVSKVSEMLRGMFEGQNSRNTTTGATQQENALSTRSGGFGQAGSGTGQAGGNARGGGGGGGFGR